MKCLKYGVAQKPPYEGGASWKSDFLKFFLNAIDVLIYKPLSNQSNNPMASPACTVTNRLVNKCNRQGRKRWKSDVFEGFD